MENASKALIIAGGILIAILIVTVAVYLFTNYGSIGKSYDQTLQTTEIQKFNENFTRYEGREDVTIQEIVTLYNFVEEYEKKIGIEDEITINTSLNLSNPAEAIDKNQGQKFSVQIVGYDSSGRINNISIQKK